MSDSLGRLALGVAGAVIGAPFGLSALGFSLGTAVGSAVFAPDGPDIVGPRVGDTFVTTSSLGKPIPEHFGVTRTGGNIIWSGGLKEKKKKESTGGKGGGGGSVTTYSYSASFACAFGRAPISGEAVDLLRIWADGKLIYDQGGTVKSSKKFGFRFLPGSMDNPDPLIAESINRRLSGLPDINAGSGKQADYRTMDEIITELQQNSDARSAIYATALQQIKTDAENAAAGGIPDYGFTPNYSEVCLIVFDDMPLEDFGNRIPNITAEIVWTSDVLVSADDKISELSVAEISADTDAPIYGTGISIPTQTWVVDNSTTLRKFSLGANSEVETNFRTQETFAGSGNESTVVRILCADSYGDFVVKLGRTGASVAPIIGKLTNNGLYISGGFESVGGSEVPIEMDATASTITNAYNVGIRGTKTLIAGTTELGQLFLYDVGDRVTVVWGTETTGTMSSISGGHIATRFVESGVAELFWAADDGVNWELRKVLVQYGDGFGVPQVSHEIVDTGTVSADGAVVAVRYDSTLDSIHVFFNKSSSGTIMRFDPEDSVLEYESAVNIQFPENSGWENSTTLGSSICVGYQNTLYRLDLSSGELTEITSVSGQLYAGAQFYSGDFDAVYAWIDGVPTAVFLSDSVAGLYKTNLSTAIAHICDRAGFSANEYDVTSIDSGNILRGYSVTRNATAKSVLSNILSPFFVDVVESDWKLRFVPRSNSPVLSIAEKDMGTISEQGLNNYLVENRKPEYNLPAEMSLVYLDFDRDYQEGAANFKRPKNPAPTTYSDSKNTLELPIVFREYEARDIVQRLLYEAWQSRDSVKMMLPWKYAALDPTDVIHVPSKSGELLTVSVSKTLLGANFSLEIDAVTADDPTFVSAPSSPLYANVPTQNISVPIFTRLFVLDLPLLEDYHNLNRTAIRFYTAVGTDSTSFTSADLYESSDNISFSPFDSVLSDVTWGTVVTPLAAPAALWSTDFDNTLTVKISGNLDNLVSDTFENLVNKNANAALVWNPVTGDGEIIQFQNVSVNADGTVTFDTLIRGRRGTDYYADKHVSGELFLLLDSASFQTQSVDLSQIGVTNFYRSVSSGGLLGAAPSVPVSFEARALKPYAPSNFVRSDDGTDLTLSWNRRTRVGGGWNMVGTGIETVPLSEDYESYTVFLIPNDFSVFEAFDPNDESTFVVKKVTTNSTVTFTSAELASGSYTLSDVIYAAVCQNSAQVGFGFITKSGLAV